MSSSLAKKDWVVLSAIIILGLVARLYRLNWQSAWYDELFTLNAVDSGWRQMLQAVIRDYVHPPLHYFSLYVWLKVFGFGVVQARLLSVLFGTLAIVVMYFLAKELFGRRTGLLAASMLAWSQLAVNHSQEGRSYALAFLLSLCTMYLFVVAIQSRRAPQWWAFVLSATLMLYSHYYTVFILGGLILFAFAFRGRYAVPWSWWVAGLLFIVICYLPWLASGVIQQALASKKLYKAVSGPMSVKWTTPIIAVNWFNNGEWRGIYRGPPFWTFFAGGLLFLVPAALALVPVPKLAQTTADPRPSMPKAALLLALWLVPMAIVLSFGFVFRMQWDIRYVVFSMAPYYVLVARGIDALERRWRIAVVLLMGIYSISSLHANYYIPFKPDYRGAVKYLVSEYREGDCVCYLPTGRFTPVTVRAWQVYQRQRPALKAAGLDDLLAGRGACTRVWLVWDYTWWMNSQTQLEVEARQKLAGLWIPVTEYKFDWVSVTLFDPKPR